MNPIRPMEPIEPKSEFEWHPQVDPHHLSGRLTISRALPLVGTPLGENEMECHITVDGVVVPGGRVTVTHAKPSAR